MTHDIVEYKPVLMTRGEFLDVVISLSIWFKLSVTSWIRTERRNNIFAGHKRSLHLVALAVDVVLDPGEDKAAFICMAKRLGLIVIDKTTHLHLQPGYPDAG